MKISIDDPRLTAYALGELKETEERLAIEAAVDESAELQRAVREIREMGDLLTAGLSEEVPPEISEFEKARMEGMEDKPDISAPPLIVRLLTWPGLAALGSAAAVALFVFAWILPTGGLFNGNMDDAVATEMRPTQLPPSPAQEFTAPQLEARIGKEQIAGRRDVEQDASVHHKMNIAVQAEPEEEQQFELSAFEVMDSAAPVGYVKTYTVSGTRLASNEAFRQRDKGWNTESYDLVEESGFRSPQVAPLSTFSIDVDTASYANVRRFLNQGQLPPQDAVRIEELINYFPYADAPPTRSLEDGGDPFAVHMEQTIAPWNKDNRLLRIALKGYAMPWEERPASNLVFLLDVSGSMSDPNKLPLVKEAMELLIRKLDKRDRVAIVVYAGASGLVLPSTTADNHETIAHAMNNLSAGGSTNAGAGIQLAYKVARDHYIPDGNNRVILCTDGDFNVGQTNRGELASIAEAQAEKGVSLTVLGFGMGNYKDDMLEELSNKGKGSYAYVDSQAEARKVFLEDLTSNLFKIAKDVKIQVEFNPAQVTAYRLIGYENRRLKAEDFNNDRKKAGDIGPGHSIVALYEIVPTGTGANLSPVDDLRYQEETIAKSRSSELATVKLRYKQPDGEVSQLITQVVDSADVDTFANASDDMRFCAAIAAFGMILGESEYIGSFPLSEVEQIAFNALGSDPGGHRSAFTGLVRKAESLIQQTPPEAGTSSEDVPER